MKRHSFKLVITSLLIAISICMGCVSLVFAKGSEKNSAVTTTTTTDNHMKMWYETPGDEWRSQLLPIGNGHLGGMIPGKTDTEKVQVNEITLWGGGPNSRADYTGGNTAGAYKHIESIRESLRNGNKPNVHPLEGNDRGWIGYQNVGNIVFDLKGDARTNSPLSYRRELDMNDGISRVSYNSNGTTFTREYFASNPGNIMVINLKANKNNKLAFNLGLELDKSSDSYNSVSKRAEMSVNNHVINCLGEIISSKMKFGVSLALITENAIVIDNENNTISVSDAEDVTVVMAIETNYDITENQNLNNISDFHEKDGRADYLDNKDPDGKVALSEANARVEVAKLKKYDELKKIHIDDYKPLFNASSIDLGDNEKADIPTDKLLHEYNNVADNRYLENLLFQYGRYMLISSSRDAVLPANLQGIWNGMNNAPWGADYHFNVNLQMNYWPAFVTNIASTADPLVTYIDSLMKPGNITAREHFGVQDGWVVTTTATPFGFTGVGWDFMWGWTPGSAAWICENLWDYYQYTQDPAVLDKIWPILKGASKFWEQFLVESPVDSSKLIAYPSTSSEHGPVSLSTTYDLSLSKMLLVNTKKAAELKNEPEIANNLSKIIARIEPYEIGDDGQIKEWYEERKYNRDENGKPIGFFGHRHVSHLLGLHPGNLIKKSDPLMKNAVTSLELRGDGQGNDSTAGWGMAQRSSLWARTGNGNKAWGQLNRQFRYSITDNLFNQLGANKWFQIDGNFGATAAVAEMLIQSHEGKVEILPALPDKWEKRGSFKGLVARGNFVTDASWLNGGLTKISITSNSGNTCKLNAKDIAGARLFANGQAIQYKVVAPDTIEFNTEKGVTYVIDNFPEKIDAPTNVRVHRVDQKQVYVTWNKIEKATSYNVYRMDKNGETICVGENLTSPVFKDLNAEYNKDYFYRYQVVGILDKVYGKASDIVSESPVNSHVDNADPAIKYSEGWSVKSDNNNYNNTSSVASLANNWAELTFVGTGIEYYAMLDKTMGSVQIFVDGALKTTCNLYSVNTVYKNKVYQIDNLDYGQHTIKIALKDAALNAEGKTGISLDYFHVLNSESKMVDYIGVNTENGLTFLDKFNQSLQIVGKILPETAFNKEVLWKATDEMGNPTNLVTLSESGLLTTKNNGVGFVKVWAMATDGSGIKNCINIFVSNKEGTKPVGFNILKGNVPKLTEGKLYDNMFGLNYLTDGAKDNSTSAINRTVLEKGNEIGTFEFSLNKPSNINSVTVYERWSKEGNKLWDDIYISRIVVSASVDGKMKEICVSRGIGEKVSTSMAQHYLKFNTIKTDKIAVKVIADRIGEHCISLWEIEANSTDENIMLNKPVKLIEGSLLAPRWGVNYLTDGYYCADGQDDRGTERFVLNTNVSKGIVEIDLQNFYAVDQVRLLERWAEGWDELYINEVNIYALVNGDWLKVSHSEGLATKKNKRYGERMMNIERIITNKIRVETKVNGVLKGNICLWEIEATGDGINANPEKVPLISQIENTKALTSADFVTGYNEFLIAHNNALVVANDLFATNDKIADALNKLNLTLENKKN